MNLDMEGYREGINMETHFIIFTESLSWLRQLWKKGLGSCSNTGLLLTLEKTAVCITRL